jgi:threonine dehydrogenase-like Zn-dependent dehydrogenase
MQIVPIVRLTSVKVKTGASRFEPCLKAIIVTPGRRGSVTLSQVEEPNQATNQTLLRPVKVGFDRTDLDINDGLYGEAPSGSSYLVAAHECLASVETPSPDSQLQRGDLVVPTVRRPDSCPNCLAGESDMCVKGDYKEHGIKGLNGFASEVAVSDTDFLVSVPDELEDVAVLLEPMSVAEKGIFQIFRVQERMLWKPERALVLGAGPLGILSTFLLRIKGLDVTAVATRSVESLKAKLVTSVGATYVDSNESGLESLGKFDIILEDTGVTELATKSLSLLKNNGAVCMLGIYGSSVQSFDLGTLYTGLVLGNKVVLGSVNANKKYFEMGLKDFLRIKSEYGSVLERMITRKIVPEEYEAAYKPDKEEIKTLMQFS